MRAVVLAAGRGERLAPLTLKLPKPMIPLDGIPILERNLRWLKEFGIDEFAINLHHLPSVVVDSFGDGGRLGVKIRWSFEPKLAGTASALWPLLGWLRDRRFLLVYGDNLVRLDIDRMTANHRARGAAVSVALWERADVEMSGVAEVDPDDTIVRFLERPRSGETSSRLINAGVMVMEPQVLEWITPIGQDVGRSLLPSLIAAGHRVVGYRMGDGESLEWIDTPADLERTRTAVANR